MRILVRITGLVAMVVALLGIYLNGTSLLSASRGVFSETVTREGWNYFYSAFYIMSGICIICFVLLLLSGMGVLFLRLRFSELLIGVLVFEVVYFFSLGSLWLVPNAGSGIDAAIGVGNVGLAIQLEILFPLWAPIVLRWAGKKLQRDSPAARYCISDQPPSPPTTK